MAHRPRGLVKVTATLAVSAGGAYDTGVGAGALGPVFGEIKSVEYAPGTLDTGADITVTDAVTGAPILTLTNAGTAARKFVPSTNVTDNLGVAVAAAATDTNVRRPITVAGKLRVVVAQGGVSLTGAISFVIDEGTPSR